MFSKEMEALIQATLEDGVLEENEKAALIKRAQKEGIDLDELEIYINSLQQKKQRELKEKNDALDAKYEKEKKEALGPVCPRCHKQVPPLTLVCDCGYEFTKAKVVSSVQQFVEKIEKINSSKSGKKEKEILDAIALFPVPNTKEDIIEFLSLSAPNTKKKGGFLWGTRVGRLLIASVIVIIITSIVWIFTKGEVEAYGLIVFGTFAFTSLPVFGSIFDVDKETLKYNARAEVWKSKFDQVLIKGRSLRGDPEFTQQLDYYEKLVK